MSTSKRKQSLTRREFIQCSVSAMVGISTFCTLCHGASAESDKIGDLTVGKENGNKCELKPIAYCGLYCGACPAYVDAMENPKTPIVVAVRVMSVL